MLLCANIMFCLFLLSSFGALEQPLKRMQIHPVAASALCLTASGCFLLENIRLTEWLHASLAGAVIPLGLCLYLWVRASKGEKMQWLCFALLCGVGGWLFEQLTQDFLETAVGLPAVVGRLLFSVFFASFLSVDIRQALFCGWMGFLLASLALFAVSMLAGQPSYTVLGGEEQALPTVILFVCVPLLHQGWMTTLQCFGQWRRQREVKKQTPADSPPGEEVAPARP